MHDEIDKFRAELDRPDAVIRIAARVASPQLTRDIVSALAWPAAAVVAYHQAPDEFLAVGVAGFPLSFTIMFVAAAVMWDEQFKRGFLKVCMYVFPFVALLGVTSLDAAAAAYLCAYMATLSSWSLIASDLLGPLIEQRRNHKNEGSGNE